MTVSPFDVSLSHYLCLIHILVLVHTKPSLSVSISFRTFRFFFSHNLFVSSCKNTHVFLLFYCHPVNRSSFYFHLSSFDCIVSCMKTRREKHNRQTIISLWNDKCIWYARLKIVQTDKISRRFFFCMGKNDTQIFYSNACNKLIDCIELLSLLAFFMAKAKTHLLESKQRDFNLG